MSAGATGGRCARTLPVAVAGLLVFAATGQGIVVMTYSDNGTALASAIIGRAAAALHWPPLGDLPN